MIVPTARTATLAALAAPLALVVAAAAPGAWVLVPAAGMALLILKTVFNVGSYAAGNDGTPARVAILLLAMLFGAAVGWLCS